MIEVGGDVRDVDGLPGVVGCRDERREGCGGEVGEEKRCLVHWVTEKKKKT